MKSGIYLCKPAKGGCGYVGHVDSWVVTKYENNEIVSREERCPECDRNDCGVNMDFKSLNFDPVQDLGMSQSVVDDFKKWKERVFSR